MPEVEQERRLGRTTSDLLPDEAIDITIQDARVIEVSGNVLKYSTLAGGTAVPHELHIGHGWPNHIVTRPGASAEERTEQEPRGCGDDDCREVCALLVDDAPVEEHTEEEEPRQRMYLLIEEARIRNFRPIVYDVHPDSLEDVTERAEMLLRNARSAGRASDTYRVCELVPVERTGVSDVQSAAVLEEVEALRLELQPVRDMAWTERHNGIGPALLEQLDARLDRIEQHLSGTWREAQPEETPETCPHEGSPVQPVDLSGDAR